MSNAAGELKHKAASRLWKGHLAGVRSWAQGDLGSPASAEPHGCPDTAILLASFSTSLPSMLTAFSFNRKPPKVAAPAWV